jgi:hypothetical protein
MALDKNLMRAGAIWGAEAFEGDERRLMVLDISLRRREEFVIKSVTYEWLLIISRTSWRERALGSITFAGAEVGTFSTQPSDEGVQFQEGDLDFSGIRLQWKAAGGGIGFYDARGRVILRKFPAWKDADRRNKIFSHSEMYPLAEEYEDALHLTGLLAVFDRLESELRDPYRVGLPRLCMRWLRW